jgi:hypothetical protein
MRHERNNGQRHRGLDHDINIEPIRFFILLEQLLELAQPEHLCQPEEPEHLQSLDV